MNALIAEIQSYSFVDPGKDPDFVPDDVQIVEESITWQLGESMPCIDNLFAKFKSRIDSCEFFMPARTAAGFDVALKIYGEPCRLIGYYDSGISTLSLVTLKRNNYEGL